MNPQKYSYIIVLNRMIVICFQRCNTLVLFRKNLKYYVLTNYPIHDRKFFPQERYNSYYRDSKVDSMELLSCFSVLPVLLHQDTFQVTLLTGKKTPVLPQGSS